jgi:hypothetical protein
VIDSGAHGPILAFGPLPVNPNGREYDVKRVREVTNGAPHFADGIPLDRASYLVMSPQRPRFVPYADALSSDDERLRQKAHTLAALAAVVPAAAACVVGVTPRRTLDEAVGLENGVPAGACERLLLDGFVEDPFGPRQTPDSKADVLRLDDLGARGVPYRWQLRTLGLCDRVTVYLRWEGMLVAIVALMRSFAEQRFTNDEVRRLRRIRPVIERAYVREHPVGAIDG